MGFPEVSVLGVFVWAIVIGIVTSYPNYVPNSPDVCSKMTPGHGPRPQRTPEPYEIILNKQKMHGGNKLQIILQGKNGHKFKGFYMQVRDENAMPIGTFLIPDEKEIGVHNCFNQKQNAIHHKSRNEKESIIVYWKPPAGFDGKVKVVATVLQDFEIYWVNVKAPDLVTVSNSTNYFISSDFIETRNEKYSKNSKANRILNYNPYSPISPLLPSDTKEMNLSPTESMLPQASEDHPEEATVRERQLFGIPSFDFHGTPLSPTFSSPRKHKDAYLSTPVHSHHPFTENIDLHPFHVPNKNVPTHHTSYNEVDGAKEKYSRYFNGPQKISLPFSYPPGEVPYHSDIPPTALHETSFAQFPPTTSYIKPSTYPPHLSQSVQNDKGGHFFINHHYLHNPSFKPNYQKPASDPSYPNSGYFPKDILTRITSYLPNIYNAIANNPLFNFNIDNTIESIWKPMKGVPTKHNLPVSSATTTNMQMPKYGYLVYNPVRKNPYFVIPAENEEEFIANHVGRRKDRFT